MLALLLQEKNCFFEVKEDKASVLEQIDILEKSVSESAFLILGAAGTIGQAVTKEIFKRNPQKLHCVDISENNLVELVWDLRSEYGIDGFIELIEHELNIKEVQEYLA